MNSFWTFRELLLSNIEQKSEQIRKQKLAMNQTSIHNLPDEILVKIFNLLNFRDRSICERVCRRWRTLVYIGVKDLIISAQDEDKLPTLLNNCNFLVVPTLSSLFFIIKKSGRGLENLKIYGFQLKKKWLPSSISKKDIQIFVDLIGEQCKNLKHLSIRKVKNLDEMHLSELLEKVGPRLRGFSYDGLITEETFNLVIDKLNSEKLTDLTLLLDNQNVLKMICSKFKNLKTFNISFYKDVKLIDLDQLNLVQCSITNHHLRAKSLVNLFQSPFNSNLKFLGLECAQVDSSVVDKLSEFKKLETLKILISKQEDLDTICRTVPSLKRLVLALTVYPTVTEIRSIRYLKSLRTLEIKCRVVQKLRFERCVIGNLKHLNLSGSSYFNERSNHFHSTLAYIFPNLTTLRLKDKNTLESQFFKMLDQMKRLRLLVVHIEQTSDLNKTLNKLKAYTNSMAIDLILCKRKSETNTYFSPDIRPLHYLEARRTFNLPKTLSVIDIKH